MTPYEVDIRRAAHIELDEALTEIIDAARRGDFYARRAKVITIQIAPALLKQLWQPPLYSEDDGCCC